MKQNNAPGKKTQSPEVIKLLKYLSFLIKHKLICYGGTAINNIYLLRTNFIIEMSRFPIMTFSLQMR